MARATNLAKTSAGTIAGVLVLAILAEVGGVISQHFLTGGDEDNATSGLPGATIGGVIGLILGGYIAGRTIRWLHASLRKPWLLLIGPGLWVWLALLVSSAVSSGITMEHLTNQLLLGAVMILMSFPGTLAGARERR
jgi:uncharacterized membrane protein YfcA